MNGVQVAFRVDASSYIGTGHVMRCLTLALALRQRGAQVYFLCETIEGNLNETVRRQGFEVRELPNSAGMASVSARPGGSSIRPDQDASSCIDLIGRQRPDWLVVDHYWLDASWQRYLRKHVSNIMVIDDLADRPHDCEMLLDQNFSVAGAARYDALVPPRCTRLIGPRYALLRDAFRQAREQGRHSGDHCRRLLIFFGGVDSSDMTSRTLMALNRPEFSHLTIDVVIGSGNPHREAVQREADRNQSVSLHIDVDNMAELMSNADLSLGAGGVATWERCCVGLPSIVVTVAANQIPSVTALAQQGVIEWLGNDTEIGEVDIRAAVRRALDSPERLSAMRSRSCELVDGFGTTRTVDILEHGVPESQWRIRPARTSDCALYFDWATDPVTRRNAFNPEPIAWDSHRRWFDNKLADPRATLLVAEADEGPVGQVRFDKVDEDFAVSYSLGSHFRGKGLGKSLLARAIAFFRQSNEASLVAETLKENVPSARVFEGLRFVEVAPKRPGSRRFELP